MYDFDTWFERLDTSFVDPEKVALVFERERGEITAEVSRDAFDTYDDLNNFQRTCAFIAFILYPSAFVDSLK